MEHRNPARTVVITGASDGIGKATATARVRTGDTVVIIGRNPTKTRAVAADLGVPYHVADFAHLDQVRELARELHGLPRIDVLVNNAGGMQPRRILTEDGYESTLQVNHLAPFLLTHLLLPKLLTDEARVINTASAAHLFGKINMDNLDFARHFGSFRAYAVSKLATVMVTRELAHRYGNLGLRTAAFHPGIIANNAWQASATLRAGYPFLRAAYHTPLRRPLHLKTTPEGADTLLWLIDTASARDWHSGNYYADRKPARYNQQVHDLQLVDNLWRRSLDMVGLEHDGTE